MKTNTHLCSKRKKHSHASKGAAEAHLRSILKQDPEYTGKPYVCDICFGWHIGQRKHKDKYD